MINFRGKDVTQPSTDLANFHDSSKLEKEDLDKALTYEHTRAHFIRNILTPPEDDTFQKRITPKQPTYKPSDPLYDPEGEGQPDQNDINLDYLASTYFALNENIASQRLYEADLYRLAINQENFAANILPTNIENIEKDKLIDTFRQFRSVENKNVFNR